MSAQALAGNQRACAHISLGLSTDSTITAARGIFGARAYDRVVWKRGILLMFSWNFLKFAYVLRVISRFLLKKTFFLNKKTFFFEKKTFFC